MKLIIAKIISRKLQKEKKVGKEREGDRECVLKYWRKNASSDWVLKKGFTWMATCIKANLINLKTT